MEKIKNNILSKNPLLSSGNYISALVLVLVLSAFPVNAQPSDADRGEDNMEVFVLSPLEISAFSGQMRAIELRRTRKP
jgi:hypothetical protein